MATANLSDGVANLARQVAIDQYAQDIDFNKKLSAKASIDSPAFTGTPTAPTPTSGDVSTSLATTEFVNNNYLPLSGGTMRGILNMGSKDLKGINWCYAN